MVINDIYYLRMEKWRYIYLVTLMSDPNHMGRYESQITQVV